ncbi:MAG: DUF4474 domain-containing protein [Lachnospiraceae bacterium]
MECVLRCFEWLEHYGLPVLSVCLVILLVYRLTKRYRNIMAVRAMTSMEKTSKINSLAEPFGYGYNEERDLFYTRVDAWQRKFGYRRAYDEAALSTGMIIHCLPVYFDYDGKTWLMEFWKGEYGITTGCEVGLYHADTILLPGQYAKAQFGAATDEEMMDMRMLLLKSNEALLSFRMQHWWLACFAVGRHEPPESLHAIYRLRFPEAEMKHAFLQGLHNTGFPAKSVRSTSSNTLLLYHNQENTLPFDGIRGWQKKVAHAYNGLLNFLYLWYTRPFSAQGDRILFLYKQLPFMAKHVIKRSGRRRYRKAEKRNNFPKGHWGAPGGMHYGL